MTQQTLVDKMAADAMRWIRRSVGIKAGLLSKAIAADFAQARDAAHKRLAETTTSHEVRA